MILESEMMITFTYFHYSSCKFIIFLLSSPCVMLPPPPPLAHADGVSWEDCPKTQALVKGRDYETIRCRAESGAPADITWIKDESLPDASRYSIESAGIRIKGSTEERDQGTYTIMATVQETGGLETREIKVEVHSKPVITDIPDTVDAVEGEAVELKCTAQAVPYATYSWIDASNRNLSDANGYVFSPALFCLFAADPFDACYVYHV